jgi:membrane protein YdbS with pleckstrin-like domain
MTDAGPFAPPAEGWNRVSPRLATVRRIVSLGWVLILGTAASVAAFVAGPAWLGALAVLASLLGFAWVSWVVGRQVAAIGYAGREDDLVVTSGILFRRLVVVPYGRMQLVDVTAGPLNRYFGIATLQLHTAAATTDATIPGLPREEAQGLRDRLAALGEARSAGL